MKLSLGEAPVLSFTALLLTGGVSKRMGRDKATLVVQGEPLWSRQLALLESLRPAAVWISARTLPAWAPRAEATLLDVPPSRGPLSGIALALERMNTTHLLALAIDLPDMPVGHLQKLAGLVEPGRGVIPMTPEHFEPLAAIYPKEAESTARTFLSSQQLAMQSLAAALVRLGLVKEYRVAEAERAFYRNLNTPADV